MRAGIDLIGNRDLQNANKVFTNSQQETLGEARTIADSVEVKNLIYNNEIDKLDKVLKGYQTKYDVSAITAIDANGVAITQNDAPLDLISKGTNVFLRSALGKIASTGQEVVSVESGKTYPLAIVAAAPVKQDGKMLGVILIRRAIDQKFAVLKRNTASVYLSQLVFYSKDNGAVGTTFANPAIDKEISAYINPSSDWVSGTKKIGMFEINGIIYRVRNAKLTGVTGANGGFLTLTPMAETWSVILGGVATICLLVFLALKRHKRYNIRETAWDFWVLMFIFACILFLGYYFMLELLLHINLEQVDKPHFQIYNSVLTVEPPASVIKLNDYLNVELRVTSGGEAINAVQVALNFDPKVAKLNDIKMEESFCDQRFILKKTIDNSAGKVEIACGLPNPGFSGLVGTVAKLIFQPLTVGNLNLTYSDGSSNKVLANDGLGTNVLRKTTGAFYRVVDDMKANPVQSPVSSAATIQKQVEALPAITPSSLDHPNSEKWYSSSSISFYWLPVKDGKYLYSLDQKPTSDLSEGIKTDNTSVQVDAPDSGIYYFHVALLKDNIIGPVSNFKVKVDLEAPDKLNVFASSDTVDEGETVRFKFDSSDNLSGLQNNYYFKVDTDTSFLPVAGDPSIAFESGGDHKVVVRVFDNAENHVDKTIIIHVNSKSALEQIVSSVSNFLSKLFSFTNF